MIYTLGETVYDIIFSLDTPQNATPGGSALNSAVSLGRLACPVAFITEIGSDLIGEKIIRFLSNNNITTSYITKYPNKSSLALAFLNENNDAQYEFYKDFPSKRYLQFPDVTEKDIILYSSSFATNEAIRDQFLQFIKKAHSQGALLIYDPNIRTKEESELSKIRSLIEENISLAHIIRGSNEDFQAIFKTTTGQSTFNKLENKKMLIYTKNKDGAELFYNQIYTSISANNISPVSTIGAGDNFNAGIMYYINKENISTKTLSTLSEDNFKDLLSFGNALATNVCMSMSNYIDKNYAESIKEGKL